MSAGTSPSASAEGARPNPLYDDALSPGAQCCNWVGKMPTRTCPTCQVRWTDSDTCWICGAEVKSVAPQIVYPHPYFHG